uniref:Uncharacterized protein n=10 Tax=Nymphaea colorata TaxID=210225 RepID=A0A5K1A3Z0_9MAGN
MGDSFNRMIFYEHVQGTLVGWAEKARRKNAAGPMSNRASPSMSSYTQAAHTGNRSPNEVQLQEAPLVHAVPTNTPATGRLEASPAKKIHAEEIAP